MSNDKVKDEKKERQDDAQDHQETEIKNVATDEQVYLPEVATVPEVAKYLRVNPKTIYEAIKAGDMPSQRVGRVIRLRREAILNWLEGGR